MQQLMLIRRKMLRETVLLLACAALAQGGVRSNQRIFGGTKATLGEFPWQVALQYSHNNVTFCSGAILDERTIVTAATCARPATSFYYHVASGVLNLLPAGNQNAMIRYIEEILYHYDYDIFEYKHDNIAIWKLYGPIVLDGVHAAAIKLLPQDTPLEVGALAQVAGWGFTEWEGNATSTDLLRADVNIKDYEWCQQMHSGELGPKEICAVHVDGGRDSCEGDTGGALSINGTLVGIVDWGNRCGQVDYRGVYTVAAKYTDWITSVSGVKPSV